MTFLRIDYIMAGLYVHIPFCRKICSYCDFYHSASLSRSDALFTSLLKEMELRTGYLKDAKVETIYLGGGTPSILKPSEIATIKEHATRRYNIDKIKEFTLECNPEDLTPDYLKEIYDIGVNRLSIGVQSLYDDILLFMRRSHSAERAIEAIEDAKRVGFSNISVDMIFGVPSLEIDRLTQEIEQIVSLEPEHISAYHLTIDHGSILYKEMQRGKFSQIEDQESQRQYLLVDRLLTEAGYNHYEVSNYALEGCEAIHNSAYWGGEPYIGIGPSAHSFDGVKRHANIPSVNRYIDALERGECYFEIEELTQTDRLNELIMTSLRRKEGLSLERFGSLFGSLNRDLLLERAAPLIASGQLCYSQEKLYIDTTNFLVSDYIISQLFDTDDSTL